MPSLKKKKMRRSEPRLKSNFSTDDQVECMAMPMFDDDCLAELPIAEVLLPFLLYFLLHSGLFKDDFIQEKKKICTSCNGKSSMR